MWLTELEWIKNKNQSSYNVGSLLLTLQYYAPNTVWLAFPSVFNWNHVLIIYATLTKQVSTFNHSHTITFNQAVYHTYNNSKQQTAAL